MIVTLTSSAFVTFSNHPLGVVHKDSRWQVAYDVGDDDYEMMVLDTGWTDVNKLSLVLDLVDCEHFRFHFQHRDGLELESLWSESVLFNTMLPLSTLVPTYVPESRAAEVLMIEEIIDDLIGWSQEPCPEVSMEIEESSEVVAVSLDQTFQVIYIDEGPSIVDPCDV